MLYYDSDVKSVILNKVKNLYSCWIDPSITLRMTRKYKGLLYGEKDH